MFGDVCSFVMLDNARFHIVQQFRSDLFYFLGVRLNITAGDVQIL